MLVFWWADRTVAVREGTVAGSVSHLLGVVCRMKRAAVVPDDDISVLPDVSALCELQNPSAASSHQERRSWWPLAKTETGTLETPIGDLFFQRFQADLGSDPTNSRQQRLR